MTDLSNAMKLVAIAVPTGVVVYILTTIQNVGVYVTNGLGL